MPYKWGFYTTENKSANAMQDTLVSCALASNTCHKSCFLYDYEGYDFMNAISISVFSQNCYLHFSHKSSQFPSWKGFLMQCFEEGNKDSIVSSPYEKMCNFSSLAFLIISEKVILFYSTLIFIPPYDYAISSNTIMTIITCDFFHSSPEEKNN